VKLLTWFLMIPVKLAALPFRAANWALEKFDEWAERNI